MATPTCVLVVDDDRDTADMFGELLRMLGYMVLIAYSGVQALELAVGVDNLAVVVFDLQMRGMSGATLSAQLAKRPHRPRMILVSGVLRPDLSSLELDDYLVKPTSVAALRASVGAAAATWWYLRGKADVPLVVGA